MHPLSHQDEIESRVAKRLEEMKVQPEKKPQKKTEKEDKRSSHSKKKADSSAQQGRPGKDEGHDTTHLGVEKLIRLFYFSQLFDTSRGGNLSHYERMAYLGYDKVLGMEHENSCLTNHHLDALLLFSRALTSRKLGALVSHEEAMAECAKLARLFMTNSTEQVPATTIFGHHASQGAIPENWSLTFADVNWMIDRMSKTGFVSAVPQLHSIDAINIHEKPSQPQPQQDQQQPPSESQDQTHQGLQGDPKEAKEAAANGVDKAQGAKRPNQGGNAKHGASKGQQRNPEKKQRDSNKDSGRAQQTNANNSNANSANGGGSNRGQKRGGFRGRGKPGKLNANETAPRTVAAA